MPAAALDHLDPGRPQRCEIGLGIYGSTSDLTSASTSGAHRLGIENMAEKCVQGRGVMIDLHAHYGREKKYVGYEDLMRILEQDRVVAEPGDLVCLHTGTAQMLLDMRKKPDKALVLNSFPALDGSDERLLHGSQTASLSP